MPPNHFLVATDLTDRAERALARALDLLPAAGRLTVPHVVPTGLPPQLASEQQRSAKAFLVSRLGLAPRQRASAIQSIVVTGGAFNAIIAEAIARAADLVIIGNPTTDHYADLFTGSTAERVIRFSDRPVLMVKHVPREHYQRILVAFDGSEGAPRAARGICFGTRRRVPHSTRVVAAPHLSWGNRSSKTRDPGREQAAQGTYCKRGWAGGRVVRDIGEGDDRPRRKQSLSRDSEPMFLGRLACDGHPQQRASCKHCERGKARQTPACGLVV